MYNLTEQFYEESTPINHFVVNVIFNDKIKFPVSGVTYKPTYDSLLVKDKLFNITSIVKDYKYKNQDSMQIGAMVELINGILMRLFLYLNDNSLITVSTKLEDSHIDFLNNYPFLKYMNTVNNKIISINKLVYYNDFLNKQYLFVSYPYKQVNSTQEQLKEIIDLHNYEKQSSDFDLNGNIGLYDWIKDLFKYPRIEELYYTFNWNIYTVKFRLIKDLYG